MNIAPPTTLTVDGKEYTVDSFSETVQRLVLIHTQWRNDLQDERLKVTKTEAAIRSLDVELTQTVAAELAEHGVGVNTKPAAEDADNQAS